MTCKVINHEYPGYEIFTPLKKDTMWTPKKKKRDVFKSLHVYCGAWQAQPFPSVIMSRPCYNICIEWCKTQSHYWMRWYSKSSPQDPCANTPLEVENASPRGKIEPASFKSAWWMMMPIFELGSMAWLFTKQQIFEIRLPRGEGFSKPIQIAIFFKEIPVVRTSAWNFTFHTWKLWNFCVLHPSFWFAPKTKTLLEFKACIWPNY